MPKVRVKLIVLLVLMFLLLCVCVLKIAGGQSQRGMVASTLGIPLVLNQENDVVNSSITQVVATKDNVFLVYGYESIVQAYSLEGTYQYTLAVYNYSNGETEIAIDNDVLYISDKRYNIYAFSGEEFIEFIDKSRSQDLYWKLHFGRSSPNYSIEAGSVWYTNGEDSHCVVERSVWKVLYQNNALDLLLLFLLILAGIVLRFPYPVKAK